MLALIIPLDPFFCIYSTVTFSTLLSPPYLPKSLAVEDAVSCCSVAHFLCVAVSELEADQIFCFQWLCALGFFASVGCLPGLSFFQLFSWLDGRFSPRLQLPVLKRPNRILIFCLLEGDNCSVSMFWSREPIFSPLAFAV